MVSATKEKADDGECAKIGVSARAYYTTGERDDEVSAITDSKIVRVGEGNQGD